MREIESYDPKNYAWVIATLKVMDEKQLIELFHDIKDVSIVEKISDCAYHFVENYPYAEDDIEVIGKSEYAEAKEIDDMQRYRDIKSTQDSLR